MSDVSWVSIAYALAALFGAIAGVAVEVGMELERRYVARFEDEYARMCRDAQSNGCALPLGGRWCGLSFWDVEHVLHEPYYVMTQKRWTRFLDPAEVLIVKDRRRHDRQIL